MARPTLLENPVDVHAWVEEDELLYYRSLAKKAGVSFSQYIRDALRTHAVDLASQVESKETMMRHAHRQRQLARMAREDRA